MATGQLVNWGKFIPPAARPPYTMPGSANSLVNYSKFLTNVPPAGRKAMRGGTLPGPSQFPQATPQQAQGAANQNPNAPAPTAPAPLPLDPTAAANIATNTFNVGQKTDALTSQMSQNDIALQSALGQLQYQQPYDQLREMYTANRSGGMYGSVEGQNQGRISQSYLDQQAGLTSNEASTNQGLAAQIQGLREGMPYYNLQQAVAAALRLSNAAEKNPATTTPSSTPTTGANAQGWGTRINPKKVTPGSARSLVNISFPSGPRAPINPNKVPYVGPRLVNPNKYNWRQNLKSGRWG